jgi:serine/threonine protein kinase
MASSGGAATAVLRAKAELSLELKSSKTHLFRADLEERYPRFHVRELQFGRVLGRGGFCVVREVKKIEFQPNFFKESCPTDRYDLEQKDREFMKDRCIRLGDARYALKQLHVAPTDEEDGPARYCEGLVDLAMEVKFLAVMDHSHIIKLRAVSDKDPCSNGFFVVLDRLYNTLEQRIVTWRKEEERMQGFFSCIFQRGEMRTSEDILVGRLIVGYDLATALLHMHSHSIIYRDLKPENIGFDVRNDVKIFDLGLAKEMIPEEILEDGTYKMTGMTGSLRYMAPEVALGKPYNQSIDVYSYGILLHQILSAETPFKRYSLNMFKQQVIRQGHRPAIPTDTKWGDKLSALLCSAWSPDFTKRPSTAQICEDTRDIISNLNGPANVSLDETNRTNKSMQHWEATDGNGRHSN